MPLAFLNWLKKVELKKASVWKTLGIYNLIQISSTGLNYDENLMLVAMHFWESSTNTMQLKCGPLLFSIGLPPIGEFYDLDRVIKIHLKLDIVAYGAFINKYFDKSTTEVSDEEHFAFLAFWLSHYVFCSRSLQIAKQYVTQATQFHEGHSFSLGRLLLGTLYKSIGVGCETLKGLTEGKTLNLVVPW